MGYDIGETAKRLKESRKAKHLTQMQVEDKTKMQIPQSTLSDYEKGKRAPKAEDIYELSCVYDVSADYLLGLQDDKTKSLEMKTFNTTGKMIASQHYMVPIDQQVNAAANLVEANRYFCINRGRQYGKTTNAIFN